MSNRDDNTPTNPQPIEALGAQLDAFRQHPADGELFRELRAALRHAGNGAALAEIDELRAQHEREPQRAAELLSEAGEARLVLGQSEPGERLLRAALGLDPANERAASRLSELLMVANRFAEAAAIFEAELVELKRRADALPPSKQRNKADASVPRRAHRHRMLAQLWDERLARVERALAHWQQAWQLEPERTDALEAARALYVSLGDDKMVARLWEAELQSIGDTGPRPRRAAIELELGRIRVRGGDGDPVAAARHFDAALRLDPASDAAREALAEVYASSAFADREVERQKAAELFVELGRKRLARARDKDKDQSAEAQAATQAAAVGYFRRALGVDPYARTASEQLEQALSSGGRWDELDRVLRQRAQLAEDPRERAAVLARLIKLHDVDRPDRTALRRVLGEMADLEPPRGPSSTRLRALLREDQAWRELSALIERELPSLDGDPPAQVAEILELATIARESLTDKDRAAELLHQALSVDPLSDDALNRYADHFRERRDWRGLADLLEFALENLREAGAAPADQVRRLEEIAQLAELRLGDLPRAIQTWQRIDELEPGSAKAREALRRLLSRAKMWDQLVGVLEQEAQAAQTPEDRAEALRRIAQTYRERQVNPRRAIALYEEIAALHPGDDTVLKALVELYEREGDDSGLAATIKRQLDLDVVRLEDELAGAGKRMPTTREWPVAKRVERLSALRRLAGMYEQRLADVEGVVFACGGILEILPGDRDALDRMERVLERAGDLERLEQTLEYHAASATGPAERAKVLRRLAQIASEAGDDLRAIDRWEQTLKVVPSDVEALAALAELFDRHGRFGELATMLERLQATHKPVEPGSVAAAARAAELKRYALVVDTRLGDATRATRAWQRVLELAGKDRDALEALARLYAGAQRWRELAEILAVQGPLLAGDEPERAAEVALERAEILEHKLGAPAEAARALEQLLAEVDPGNLDAHTALRRLYEARGDFQAAVRIAEREMFLAVSDGEKVARGVEIGLLCRDRLNDPLRALQAFERVVAIAPENDEALAAAAELQARLGDWRAHVRTLEKRIPLAGDEQEQRALMTRIAQATAERLTDHRAAFGWWRRAHDALPDGTTIADLRRAAEAYGLWRELAEVYEQERVRLGGQAPGQGQGQAQGKAQVATAVVDVAAYVAACRELSAIAERRLADRARAIAVLLDALRCLPRDAALLSEAERVAVEADQKALWGVLLQCLEVALQGATPAERVALHGRRARILEERLGDGKAAVAELLSAFSWAPERDETRTALYDLAERSRAWNEVVAVEQALVERTVELPRRVEILRRKAQVVEDKLRDPVRAFRTHLVAFLMSPEDGDTTAHLWRLGRSIQRYRDADKTPRTEPPPAAVQPDHVLRAAAPSAAATATARAAMNAAAAAVGAAALGGATRSGPPARRPIRRDPTEELDESHLRELMMDLPPEERTQPLDLAELEAVEEARRAQTASGLHAPVAAAEVAAENGKGKHRGDPTMELAAEDLASLVLPSKGANRGDPTMELAAEDLAGLVVRDTGRQAMEPPGLPGVAPARAKPLPSLPSLPRTPGDARGAPPPPSDGRRGPPPPPPRPPQITAPPVPPRMPQRAVAPAGTGAASSGVPGAPMPVVGSGASSTRVPRTSPPGPPPAPPSASRRPAPLPMLPVRAYDSPWEELAAAYESLPAADDAAHVRWLFRAAEIWEIGAANIDRAFYTLARTLEMARSFRGDAEPRARLQRLAADHDGWDRLADLYETAAEEADSAPEAIELLMEVAQIRRRQQQPREAEALYRRVLGIRPDDEVARSRIEELYRSEGRWIDLAASLEERTDPRLGTATTETDRPALLRELATIYAETLHRPHDAIDALDRLRALTPGDVDVLRRQADLYASVARWSKVIEMLNRICEIAEAGPDARLALRRIAQIYEQELELPDRAIEAYGHIIALWPDDAEAFAALDALYQGHGRWQDLADVLRRRAALAREPSERAGLLRRRARVLLDWLNAPADAVTALRQARTINPDDATVADELVEALIRGDRHHEAAATIESRITSLEQIGSGTGDLAALWIRLASLRADALADEPGARTALDRALALVPDHPTALAVLGKLARAEEDPRAYAMARLREADLVVDADAKVEALLAAGAVLRDRVGDMAAARAAFERVLGLRPHHADATWALAGLIEQGGDHESAARLLERRLEETAVVGEEKARICTQLAALARHAGVELVAERRLEEALVAKADHLPAIIGLVDLYSEGGRHEDAVQFLCEVLPTLGAPAATAGERAGSSSLVVADLHRRLALAYEQLGRDDEAYQTLLAADRLHRGQLLIKLALGENRYKARRWREAALHLAALATHEDAERYPAEIAQGLYHAALAEIRSLRPQQAQALYLRALELKPNYAPALQALAEQAMENGDHQRATELLARQAAATEEPAERMRLFEALGDMALMLLKDEARARICYDAAINAAQPLESKHLPLLEKLLERQDLAADHLGAARTAELMASFGADASARAARYSTAAASYLSGGDRVRARNAAERAVEADPADLTAVELASTLLLEAGELEAAAAALGRALSGKDDGDEVVRARRAALWSRFAEVRTGRGDGKGAITAWERAVAIAPHSEGALAARRALLTAWKDDPSKRDVNLTFLRELAAETLAFADVGAYAVAMVRAAQDALQRGDGKLGAADAALVDGARAALELGAAMGREPGVHEVAFLLRHKTYAMAPDEGYRGVVDAADRALITDPDDGPLLEILTALWDAAALLWSNPDDALERSGVVGARRVTAAMQLPVARMFPSVAAALATPPTLLYAAAAGASAPDIGVVCVSPPLVVLGPRLQQTGSDAPHDVDLRFHLGRAAELARPERVIAAGLPAVELTNLVASLGRVFGSAALGAALPTTIDDADVRRAHDELLRTTLPVKLRSRLELLLRDVSPADLDLARCLAAGQRAADRAGLIACGDITAALLRASGGSDAAHIAERAPHVVRVALAPGYLTLRAKLGTAVR